jgi:hypothetical protein
LFFYFRSAVYNYLYSSYTITGAKDLRIYDISSPTSPLTISENTITEAVGKLHVIGNFAYGAARAGGLRVIQLK